MERIVLVTGGFDPLHSGHIDLFNEAKKLGDKLVVGVNSDEWLTRKKGRPFMPFKERLAIIKELAVVDRVISFDDSDDTAGGAIFKLMSTTGSSHEIIFANGGDRKQGAVPEEKTYADKVKFMQGSLNEWIIKTNDLGEFNEVDLIDKFLVDGSQPKLSPLNVNYKDGRVLLHHDDNEITILWRKIGEQKWEIYSSGLNPINNIEAKAVQIGYEDSEITKILL